MPYKLNNILLSTYGFIPGRIAGEKIAVKGIFDLPKRIGDTHYSWAESNGVQPFVDADEIFLDGRTIYFQGILEGNKTTLKTLLNTFKTVIDAFNDVVPFETPYGTYCVLVNKITPTLYNGGATVLIEFFEPQVGATCSIGSAPTVYNSLEYSETATKNNCDSGYFGSTVTLTAPAGKFTSTVSQAAANLLAVQWVRDYKQDYANATGTCTINPPVWYNVKQVSSLAKNDCESGYLGTTVSYEVPAFKYSSFISQVDADGQAQEEIDTILTQSYANENGTCLVEFLNEPLFFDRQKNDCPSGYTGTTRRLYVPGGTYSSTISQAHADGLALAFAETENSQVDANASGSCIIDIPAISRSYNLRVKNVRTKKWIVRTPTTAGDVIYFIAYGVVISYTVTAFDTAITVATALKNLINNTTIEQWNAEKMYPIKLFSGTKPKASTNGSQLIVSIDYYLDPYFDLYI